MIGPQLQDSLPPFTLLVPLPFRILFLLTLGATCWACNLHGLHLSGINPAATLGFHHTGTRASASPWYSAYYLALVIGVATVSNWVLYRICSYDASTQEMMQSLLPYVSLFGIALILIAPVNLLFRRERHSFFRLVDSQYELSVTERFLV